VVGAVVIDVDRVQAGLLDVVVEAREPDGGIVILVVIVAQLQGVIGLGIE
jgi:hypothetical protein